MSFAEEAPASRVCEDTGLLLGMGKPFPRPMLSPA